MEKFDELTHKQKREIATEKIVEWITKEAGSQITVFTPSADTAADLVVKKRGIYPLKELYIQVLDCEKIADQFVKNIPKEEFRAAENLYLIFTFFDPVEQDINDYLWLLPSLEFENLTEPELKFQASINLEEKNKYTNFLINKRNLAEFLLRILASKKFEWPKATLEKILIIDLKKLKKIIIEARQNTFAGEGIPVGNPRLIGSKQLEYKKGDYFYRDIYFEGKLNFIGQEVVYQNNKPIWSMVYFGSIEPKEISKFLRKSLLTLSEKCRFGEICRFEEEEFLYEDKGKGKMEKFDGEEKIFVKGKEVYNLKYLGGLVSK